MKHSYLFTQAGISAVFAWLSMKLGVLLFPMGATALITSDLRKLRVLEGST